MFAIGIVRGIALASISLVAISCSKEELVFKREMYAQEMQLYKSTEYSAPNSPRKPDGTFEFKKGSVIELDPGASIMMMGVQYTGLPLVDGKKGTVKWDPSDSKNVKIVVWNTRAKALWDSRLGTP